MLTALVTYALDKYFQLTNNYPQLFASRSDRSIILQRETLEDYARNNDTILGLVAETEYTYFIVDLLEKRDSTGNLTRFPYQRLVYKKQLEGAINSVVLGVIENGELGHVKTMVFVVQERHATGKKHLELPRGFGEIGLTGEENALAELKEESGYIGETATLLGKTYTDTGMTDAEVSYYMVPVIGRLEASPDQKESIAEVRLISFNETRRLITQQEITDGYTIQALYLYGLQHEKNKT